MRTNRAITVGVLCEGALLDEHAHQNEDDYTVSCFIPGEAAKTFEIFVSNDLPAQDVSISIRLDGAFIGRYFLGHGQSVLPGLYVSECLTKPFRFRELIIPDEQTIRDPRLYRWENMGLMEFCVYRCVRTSRVSHIVPITSPPTVSTGPERPIPPIEGVQGVTIDPPNEPFARVVFRYRPRAILQAQGVIRSGLATVPTALSTMLQIADLTLSQNSPSTTSHTESPIAPRYEPPLQLHSIPGGLLSAPEARDLVSLSGDGLQQQPQEGAQPGSSRHGGSHGVDHNAQRGSQPQGRFNPYTQRPPRRVLSRAHSLPEQPNTVSGNAEKGGRDEEVEGMDVDVEELTIVKTELGRVYDNIQRAMQQLNESVDVVNTSMRQLRVLEWQVGMIERRQRERLAHTNTPTPRPSRLPSPPQEHLQPPPFPAQEEPVQQRPEQTIPHPLQLPPSSQYRSQPLFPPLSLRDSVKRETPTPEGGRQLAKKRQLQPLLPMPPNNPTELPMTLDVLAPPDRPSGALQWPA